MVLNGDFSKGRVGEYAKGFTKIALQVEDFRWTKIARCCIAQMQADGDGGHLISASVSMNVNRGTMALGSSPVKEDDDDF
jgi:pyruvoyl-dependent arginine decarboxylase (PvlArgDC)